MIARAAVLLAVLLGAASCSGLAESIKAAGQDHANLCATYTGLYGRITLSRSNVAKGTLTCNSDGHRLAPE